jgi:acyl-coenzyme A thioesterase PaaI-like protein
MSGPPEDAGSGRPAAAAGAAGTADGRRRSGRWRRRLLAALMNLYPPYLGAGIRVRPAPPREGRESGAIEVRMRLRFWNRNVVGTHFGGSLYSMCDPFFVLILRQELGPGYVVWDKAAAIRFRRPGRGTVAAVFAVPAATVADVRARADRGETIEPTFEVEVTDRQGEVVAVVEKRLHVRRRDARREAPAQPLTPS